MFKVEFFVDDRRLADVLRSLAGLIHGSPSVVPVVNVEQTKNGKLVAQTNGSLTEQFTSYLIKSKTTETSAQDAKAFLRKVGRSPLSSNYLLKESVKRGILKKHGRGNKTTYSRAAR